MSLKKSSDLKVFKISTYRHENFFKKIKLFFQDIKFCYQRVKYGWCDGDTWSIDMWFLNIIPQMIQQLKEEKHGYPGTMTEEEWDKILDDMIFYFTEACEETCSQINQYDLFDENQVKNYLNRDLEIFEYRDKCKDKALDMFKKYFWNLWD